MSTTYKLTPGDTKRFWGNVDLLGEHWWWVGPYNNQYPLLPLEDGTNARPAAIALQLAGRPLPDGYNIRYLCLNGQCINPEHISIYNRRSGPWNYFGRKRKHE